MQTEFTDIGKIIRDNLWHEVYIAVVEVGSFEHIDYARQSTGLIVHDHIRLFPNISYGGCWRVDD